MEKENEDSVNIQDSGISDNLGAAHKTIVRRNNVVPKRIFAIKEEGIHMPNPFLFKP